jgi:putative ABC transport system permease protein
MIPRWLRWLERAFLHADDREFLAGDLEEAYWLDLRRNGSRRAAARYACGIVFSSSRKVAGMLAQLWNDLRQARRALWRRPGFALTAILTIGVGIGATTTIFTVAHAVLLTPLAYPQPDRLLFVSSGFPGSATGGDQLSILDIREIAARSRTLADIAAYNTGRALQLRAGSGDSRPERVRANIVGPAYLGILGARAARGRLFDNGDDRAAKAHPVVIVTDAFWRRRLAADPGVIGRTLTLSDVPLTIVGVLDASFRDVSPEDGYAYQSDVFIPEMMVGSFASPALLVDRSARNFWALARVKPGATVEQAKAEVAAIGTQLATEFTSNRGFTFWADRVDVYLTKDARAPIILLLAASAFVLLIGCTNVANLVLERLSARRRELAVRRAVGAGRRHLVSLMLAESSALAIGGGALGLAIASAGAGAFRLVVPPQLSPRLDGAGIDRPVLLFAAALTIGVAFALATVAAVRSSGDRTVNTLRDGSRGATDPRGGRTRRLLLIGEVAATVMLVIAAGLMLDSLSRLRQTALGFRTDRLITLEMDLRAARYADPATVNRFGVDLVREVGAVRGVESAMIWGPGRPGHTGWVTFPGAEGSPLTDARMMTWRHSISPGALAGIGIPLRRGREFTARDAAATPLVAIVSETLARSLWPGGEPLGKRLRWDVENPNSALLTVVGVAADAKQRGRLQDLLFPARDLYVPHAQRAERMIVAVVRASQDPSAIVEPVRAAVARLDPDLPVFNVRTLRQQMSEEEGETRFAAVLMTTYGGVALLLAAIGIYGVLSYHVTLRTREIAVRMALGATRGEVQRMVVRDGMAPALTGIGVGLAGAAALTRLLSGILFGVQPRDPGTFASVATVLGLVALAATILPARRATAVEPLEALRAE